MKGTPVGKAIVSRSRYVKNRHRKITLVASKINRRHTKVFSLGTGDIQAKFDGDTEKVVDEHYSKIFEHELYSWHLAKEDWPENRDRKAFHDWFEVEAHSLILDLCDYAIEIEDFSG